MSATEIKSIQSYFLKSQHVANIGVKDGLTGAALKGMLLSKQVGSSATRNALMLYGENLIGKVISKAPYSPMNFGYGLAGIGWAIGLLIKEKLIEAEQNLFEEIDARIAEISFSRCNESLFYGFEGYLHYILSRLATKECRVFFPESLLEEIDDCTVKYSDTSFESLKNLCGLYMQYRNTGQMGYSFGVEDHRIQTLLKIE